MKRVVLVVALVAACQASSGGDDELGEAKATVNRFFDALGRGDCATLGELVPATAGSAACDKFIHEWREELQMKLLDISDVRRDGRDKRAIIVTASVMRSGKQGHLLLRMTHDGGSWRLVM